ncbi:MAG TPA: Flp pilus assembly protein CpaB [Bryobacteraceae bacterium]|nr:Flp pilus assembly protein CpaB [Bryobacteraceae bacterium]
MDRQKIVMIFVGAWVSAALLTWFLYAATKAPRAEKTVSIQAAARDLPAGTRLRKADLKTVRVPEADAPKFAILDEKLAIDRALLLPVTTNEPLTSAKVASAGGPEGLPALIDDGMRAIAVPINESSGVAGLIQPRAHVDVLFTRPGSLSEAVTTTIIEDVVVLAMGRTTEATSSATIPATGQAAAAPRTAQSATLLVSPEQARMIELAKNEGKVSLSLRNPLDESATGDDSPTTASSLVAGFAPKTIVKAAPPPPPPPPPPKVIIEKQAPPPPKNVIDVFRGDKHSQEVFK